MKNKRGVTLGLRDSLEACAIEQINRDVQRLLIHILNGRKLSSQIAPTLCPSKHADLEACQNPRLKKFGVLRIRHNVLLWGSPLKK